MSQSQIMLKNLTITNNICVRYIVLVTHPSNEGLIL